jgi:hypothetical protein
VAFLHQPAVLDIYIKSSNNESHGEMEEEPHPASLGVVLATNYTHTHVPINHLVYYFGAGELHGKN